MSARRFNGRLSRTGPLANIPHADINITPRFDRRCEDAASNPLQSSYTETLLAPHTAAACAVQIFAVFIFEYGASIRNIRKFAPFENFPLYGSALGKNFYNTTKEAEVWDHLPE